MRPAFVCASNKGVSTVPRPWCDGVPYMWEQGQIIKRLWITVSLSSICLLCVCAFVLHKLYFCCWSLRFLFVSSAKSSSRTHLPLTVQQQTNFWNFHSAQRHSVTTVTQDCCYSIRAPAIHMTNVPWCTWWAYSHEFTTEVLPTFFVLTGGKATLFFCPQRQSLLIATIVSTLQK